MERPAPPLHHPGTMDGDLQSIGGSLWSVAKQTPVNTESIVTRLENGNIKIGGIEYAPIDRPYVTEDTEWEYTKFEDTEAGKEYKKRLDAIAAVWTVEKTKTRPLLNRNKRS